jgi:O-antigen ligase
LIWLSSYTAVFSIPFALVRSRKWAQRCLIVVLCSSLVPLAYGFVEAAYGITIVVDRVGIISTFTHPNIFGFYLVIQLSLTLFLLKSTLTSTSLRAKLLLQVYAAVLIIALLLTGARGPWFAAAIVSIIYAGLIDRRYLLALLLVPSIVLIPGVEDRFTDLQAGNFAGERRLNSFAWREMVWQNTLNWLADNLSPLPFLVGHGLSSFEYYAPRFIQLDGEARVGGPHNVFLQLFFEMGILGCAGFLWAIGTLFARLKRGYSFDKRGAIMMMSLALAYLIVSYSDNMVDSLAVSWYFWFIMGVGCAWYRLEAAPLPAVASGARLSRRNIYQVRAQSS